MYNHVSLRIYEQIQPNMYIHTDKNFIIVKIYQSKRHFSTLVCTSDKVAIEEKWFHTIVT